MTKEDIIRMAREAWLVGLEENGLLENFECFAKLVAAAEREACAVLVETLLGESPELRLAAVYVAAEIRERGNT
jgi:hypothetical protein